MTIKIASFSGLIGCGKNAAAEYLISKHGFEPMSFASSLKDAISSIFGWDRKMLEGITEQDRQQRETVDAWWSKRLQMPQITPRWVMQNLGTNVLREYFHSDIWIASLENKLRTYDGKVVITDARFSNEIAAIKAAGGTTFQILRGDRPKWYQHAVNYNSGQKTIGWAIGKYALEELGIHPSEYSHVGISYDFTIENNSSLADLYEQIENVISSQ